MTLAAAKMTCSAVPLPSRISWCFLPLFRRSGIPVQALSDPDADTAAHAPEAGGALLRVGD